MRKVLHHLIVILALLPSLVRAQNSYTVSNVPGSSANFKTLQGAHDSVPAGSILYVLPSSATYGDVVLTKKLTVYGTGFFLGANLAPNTQASSGGVILNSITFRSGSDNSFVEGLQLTDITVNSRLQQRFSLDTVANVIISRCLLTPPNAAYSYCFYLSNANNCTIQNCFYSCQGRTISTFINMYGVNSGYSGIQFRNNILDLTAIGRNGFFAQSGLGQGVTTNATFSNNLFLIDLLECDFADLNYSNNIFVNTGGPGTFTSTGHGLGGSNLNNICQAPLLFPTTGNNKLGANTDSMFVGSLPGYHSTDQQWMLRDTSFANTYGVGCVACGPYGGSSPYKLSGIPAIPYIYSLNVPSQATAPGTIGVRIKARASN